MTRYQPESARGTIGTSPTMPTVTSAKPRQMMLLGRRSPAFWPASSAIANMLRDRGAMERPACIALYSRTIWR